MRARAHTIPNFTDPTWQSKRSDQQLMVSILEGKGTRMPAFHGRIGDKEARELVAFLRATSPTRTRPHQSSPTDFEDRFRQLEQQYGDLDRELRKLSPR